MSRAIFTHDEIQLQRNCKLQDFSFATEYWVCCAAKVFGSDPNPNLLWSAEIEQIQLRVTGTIRVLKALQD